MTTRPFQQVDVFTAVPFKGNPVAVILYPFNSCHHVP